MPPDAAAAARAGADETARKASRQASRRSERAKERPPERVANAGRLARVHQGQCQSTKNGTARHCPIINHEAELRPRPRPQGERPVGEEIVLSTTTNYPTTYTHEKDLNRIASSNWLVTALKCNSRKKSGYVVRAYHPGARCRWNYTCPRRMPLGVGRASRGKLKTVGVSQSSAGGGDDAHQQQAETAPAERRI